MSQSDLGSGEPKPRGKSRKQSTKKPFAFLNSDLTALELEIAKEDIGDGSDVEALLDDLVSSGYKVSVSIDEKNHSAIAALTDKRPESAFENNCITARAPDWRLALALVHWKHNVHAGEDWSAFGGSALGGMWG